MTFNGVKTVILLGALTGIFMLFGGLIGGQSGLTIALIMALIMNGIAYFFSDKIVLRLYKANPLSAQEYPHIYSIVQELAGRMQLPMPKLWIISTPMANAFATGRDPHHASVAVTTGILKLLNEEELRGVLAHELSHVKNRDILISSLAATLAGAIGYLANMAQYHALYNSTSSDANDRGQRGAIGLFVMALLMPLIATLLQLALSRSREFMADESGAVCTHEPLALAAALKKIHESIPGAHLDPRDVQKAATSSLFIVQPFHASGFTALLSTHPPVGQRIEKLQKMAQQPFMR